MSETKTKLHFNVIDLIIIIVIIGCVIGFALRRETKTELENARDSVTYAAFVITNVANDAVNDIQVGDKLYSVDTSNCIGELIYCASTPYKKTLEDKTGHQKIAFDETNSDIYCIVKIEGVDTDNGYFIDGTEYIGNNSSVICNTGSFHGAISVMQISEDSEALTTYISEIVANPKKYVRGEA